MPVDQAVLDFHPLEEVQDAGGARMQRGLLVAAAREMVLSNVRAVEQAGLRAAMVDLTSFAVLRSVGHDRRRRRRDRGAGRRRRPGHQHRRAPAAACRTSSASC